MQPVPLSDPRIAAIPVRECGEPLVDVRVAAPVLVDSRRADPAGAYAHLRSGMVDRLVTAQSLLPRGIRLLIIEGHWPPSTLEPYGRVYRERLGRAHPDWAQSALDAHTSWHVAQPFVAAHVTGGAVDLTLCTDSGTELPMGTVLGPDPDAVQGACHADGTTVPEAALRHRRLLGSALRAVRLVNYPTRWWHWSHGDRYWAFATGAAVARYGPVDLPDRRRAAE